MAETEKTVELTGNVPVCPVCSQTVTHLRLVLRDEPPPWSRPFLEPCGHEIASATYHESRPRHIGDDDPPHAWSWQPLDTDTGGDGA